MKKISVLIATMLALVFFSGASYAAETEYKVMKGDTLWGISHQTWGSGKLWHKIAEANNISDPRKLRAGKVIRLPELVETIKITNHNTSPYGAHAVKGDPRVLAAIDNTLYSVEVKTALKKVVSEMSPTPYILMKGEKAECVSDKSGIYCSTYGYEFAWEKIGALRADIWSTEVGNRKYEVFVIEVCGNFNSRSFEAPGITIETPPVISPPVTPESLPPPVEEALPAPKMELRLPPAQKPVIKLPEPSCCPPEHEPIIGAGIWGNGIAKGNWYYGEYLDWLKADCDSEYSYGVGFYLNGEDGDSRISNYEWWGFGAGPQVGIKRYWFYTDKFGVDRPQQWTVKARLMWETLRGGNPTSGYANRQNDLKAGIYSEYIRQMSEKWQGSLTAEGWYNFNRHLVTTWSGDKPSDRTQINLGAFAQYKMNDKWQLRFGGGPFYQGWDHLTGLHARAELRYKEILMFGPYANLFPWKTAAYEGIPLGDLQTVGAFVRVEFGPIIRDWDYARRAKRIQKFQRELNPEGKPEPVTTAPVQENPNTDVSTSRIVDNSPSIQLDKNGEPVTLADQARFDHKVSRMAWPYNEK